MSEKDLYEDSEDQNLENRIDQVFQSAFKAVSDAAEEELDLRTASMHPSHKSFAYGDFAAEVSLGQGISLTHKDESGEISEEEFRDRVGDNIADAMLACAEMWQSIGGKQMETLSEGYLQRYM